MRQMQGILASDRPVTTEADPGTAGELVGLNRLLDNPNHRPFPFTAAEVAKLLNLTPQYVRNLANRPETRVKRHSGGYDIWEVKRWLLIRNAAKVTRQKMPAS